MRFRSGQLTRCSAIRSSRSASTTANFGAGIDQAVFELGAGPPGVQRRHDRAQGGGGVEGDRPFRQVAHDDGDAVALLHAHLRAARAPAPPRAEEGLEADALVLVDEEIALAVHAADGIDDVAQGRRRVLPHPRRHAADVDLSISKGWPGAVRSACASASDIAGQGFWAPRQDCSCWGLTPTNYQLCPPT